MTPDEWNDLYPPGTSVVVVTAMTRTRTIGPALERRDGVSVVAVEGRQTSVDLDTILPGIDIRAAIADAEARDYQRAIDALDWELYRRWRDRHGEHEYELCSWDAMDSVARYLRHLMDGGQ